MPDATLLTQIKQQASNRLSGRLILVTGASKGIGASVAMRLAAEGAHVILAARNVGKLETVDDAIQALGGTATIVPADVADPMVPNALAEQIAARWGKLDGLVANAGLLGALSPVDHLDDEEWQRVFNINLHANYRLMHALCPLLRESGTGRVVTVSSGAVTNPRPFWAAYAASKAALEALTVSFALENQAFGVAANILDPGRVRTDMRAEAKPGEDPMTLPTGGAIAHTFVDLLTASCDQNAQRVTSEPISDWRTVFG